MATKRILLLGLLAACGSKAVPASVHNDSGGMPTPPYRALFDDGRRWTFDVHYRLTLEELPVRVLEDSSYTANCLVTGVNGGNLSHIRCRGLLPDKDEDEPLSGDWFADGSGLYKVHGTERALVLAAGAAERCWRSYEDDGMQRWQSLCFGEGGITRGNVRRRVDGTTREIAFRLKETR